MAQLITQPFIKFNTCLLLLIFSASVCATNTTKDSVLKMKGTITKEIILGKDQKTTSYCNYFFHPSDKSEKIFIRLDEGQVSEQELENILVKKTDQLFSSETLEVTAGFKTGSWDSEELRMKSNVDIGAGNKRKGKYMILHRVTVPTAEFTGRIIKSQQVNQAGRKLSTYDFFFECEGESYFIKSCANSVDRNELEEKVNAKDSSGMQSLPIKISGEIRNGLWDTDDPKQQSRIGKYICIYKIF